MLVLGDKGPDVDRLQDWLISIDFLDSREPYFSFKTKRAIQNLQKFCDVKVTGEYVDQLKIVYNLKLVESLALPTNAGETDNAQTQSGWDFNKSIGTDKSGLIQCYVYNLNTAESIVLPHVPDEYTQSKSNNFEEVATKGRSSPFYGYSGSSARTLEFTVVLDANYLPGHDLQKMLTKIINLAYPRYGNMIVPPKCAVRVGDTKLEGILNDVNITKKLPIINGAYSQAEVSFNFTECEPYGVSAGDIRDKGFPNGGV